MRQCRGQNIPMGGSLLKEKAKAFAKELGIEFSAWRAVTPLTIHSCFKKSGFPSPNLVDVDDTLTELNAEPSLREALPKQDLTFDDYELVTTTLLYGEPYRTLKLWLWTTIIQKVMKTNRRS
ncbi:hypothetical protein TNCV_4000181 [Trichonephila clavipes]|nr:hypothetical protein TNCV_4000181 [Trichonephila clavipes]